MSSAERARTSEADKWLLKSQLRHWESVQVASLSLSPVGRRSLQEGLWRDRAGKVPGSEHGSYASPKGSCPEGSWEPRQLTRSSPAPHPGSSPAPVRTFLSCTWSSTSRANGSFHLHQSGRQVSSARFAHRTLSPREAGCWPYPRAQPREQPSGLLPRCQGCVPVPTAAYPSSSGTRRVCSACPQCQAKSQER